MTQPTTTTAPLRLGSRGSKLARWQAEWVAKQLSDAGVAVQIVEVRTAGDVRQVGPIETIGMVGVFTKAIQEALLDERIDFAVHSLKDLPTTPVPGLEVVATPPRAPLADALIAHHAASLAELPAGALVGTGSYRRRAQLLNARPDLQVGDLRGNVETRLAKLDAGDYDAILLAEAGLHRLGLSDRIACRLSPAEMLPAPGQGALGIECRAADTATQTVLTPLNDPITHLAVLAERSALARLEGGCLAALGAWARLEGAALCLTVGVFREDGQRRLDAQSAAECATPAQAVALGRAVAEDLLAQGAADLLRAR
ncbi:hydroxymethylbilane synthase [Botrimarina hoheduenensis]|uniref:Porphobilinogen deaminase n=1 Tax=Botrimarina hoheduenensis TaxID=2528000 RepID=A0A5C5VVR7_9BACT|nr:hydroxymethylbilane synthase [Botrimarina hoheduenensis]TWT42684.1 Porphobilinogen deaminase [Botrimarina hoheduenensis]